MTSMKSDSSHSIYLDTRPKPLDLFIELSHLVQLSVSTDKSSPTMFVCQSRHDSAIEARLTQPVSIDPVVDVPLIVERYLSTANWQMDLSFDKTPAAEALAMLIARALVDSHGGGIYDRQTQAGIYPSPAGLTRVNPTWPAWQHLSSAFRFDGATSELIVPITESVGVQKVIATCHSQGFVATVDELESSPTSSGSTSNEVVQNHTNDSEPSYEPVTLTKEVITLNCYLWETDVLTIVFSPPPIVAYIDAAEIINLMLALANLTQQPIAISSGKEITLLANQDGTIELK